MKNVLVLIVCYLSWAPAHAQDSFAGNPVFPGWYADPEGIIFNDEYWNYPTYSAPLDEQVFLDAFSSPDLVHWTKHERIIDMPEVKWARRAMWAPAIVEKDDRYFLFFAANDIQSDEELGGIGVAVADSPSGPFKDHLEKPLIPQFHHGAQPIDQFFFQEQDGQYYMYYGGRQHCNVAKLNDDFTGFVSFDDDGMIKPVVITDEGVKAHPLSAKK